MADREPLVDASAVAEHLGTARSYVLRLALLGKIPAIPLPSLDGRGERTHWRFRMSEIERWTREKARRA